jgi:hypothetical protein
VVQAAERKRRKEADRAVIRTSLLNIHYYIIIILFYNYNGGYGGRQAGREPNQFMFLICRMCLHLPPLYVRRLARPHLPPTYLPLPAHLNIPHYLSRKAMEARKEAQAEQQQEAGAAARQRREEEKQRRGEERRQYKSGKKREQAEAREEQVRCSLLQSKVLLNLNAGKIYSCTKHSE